ncbi:MAG: lytic transglycosylase domain-containing protein [Clostridia bacterium]|nr:lytic transglycosylase domain-containing protein [Clostridia bacterium]
MAKHKRKNVAGHAVSGVIIAAVLLLALCFIYATVYKPWSMKSRYILEYEETIRAHSEQYGVDPYLVAAMIYCESTYNPQAVSSVGARGLMQVMPDTGEWIAKKIDIEEFTEDMLFDTSINIEMGCWYMSFLLERYEGNQSCAVGAYHCGHGKMDGWLEDPMISSDGKTLENIPEGETKKYINRVNNAYDIYKELYPDIF